MRKRTVAPKKQTKKTGRDREFIPWKYSFLTVVCASILILGFFFAARQHFSLMDYGIKNSQLRKQIEELESEKRRLLLAKEISLSPLEIKKAARKMGFTEMTASNIEAYWAVPAAKDNTMHAKTAEQTPSVTKTVINEPARSSKNVTSVKSEKPEKQVKKEAPVKYKKEATLTSAIAGIRK